MPLSFWIMVVTVVLTGSAAEATQVPCSFRAQGEAVELRIVADQQEIWSGRLPKGERQTVRVPEGDFTVESQVYNPNLKTKETIVARAHTESCQSDRSIPVPFFPE
ncbi:MAG: hypothetical protein ACREJU_19700 [Nitrospiraceae bacterium]